MAENELVQVDDFVWVNPDQLTHVRIKLNVGGSTTFRLDYMAGDAVLGTVCSDDDKALFARVELYKRGVDVNAHLVAAMKSSLAAKKKHTPRDDSLADEIQI